MPGSPFHTTNPVKDANIAQRVVSLLIFIGMGGASVTEPNCNSHVPVFRVLHSSRFTHKFKKLINS